MIQVWWGEGLGEAAAVADSDCGEDDHGAIIGPGDVPASNVESGVDDMAALIAEKWAWRTVVKVLRGVLVAIACLVPA